MKNKFASLTLASLLTLPGITFAAYHTVVAGDTLTQLAESKYGNWVKWKDLWKLNQNHVSNPDLIYPGQRLKLFTEDELDKLYAENTAGNSLARSSRSANETANDAADSEGDDDVTADDAMDGVHAEPRGTNDSGPGGRSRKRHHAHHSQEWRLLPLQSWEKFVFKIDPAVDPDGFDRRSKVSQRIAEKTTANITIASDRIPVLGEVTNARSEYERLFLGDQIFVRADEQLQVGTVYSITTGPQKIVSPRDGRVGFGYDLTGKVQIVGVRDGTFIGTITAIYYPIRRKQLLIPEVKAYIFPEAIVAPAAVSASILVPANATESLLDEEKVVILDVGTAEGVQPGMIFRHYLHTDPYTGKSISAKDFLIEAELKVLAAQEKFSVAIILTSHNLIHIGDDVVSLTDLSDFEKNQGIQSVIQGNPSSAATTDLDQIDSTDGMGEKENHDLKQLEDWAGAPAAGDEDVKRIENHPHTNAFDIGKEPAPNDGSGAKPQTAPTEADPGPADPGPATPPPVVANPADAPPAAGPVEVPSAPPPTEVPPPPPATDPAQSFPPSNAPPPVNPPGADPFATPAP